MTKAAAYQAVVEVHVVPHQIKRASLLTVSTYNNCSSDCNKSFPLQSCTNIKVIEAHRATKIIWVDNKSEWCCSS